MIYLQLFFEFFKVGLFSIGGGLATIPFLNDIALRYDWFTIQTLTDMIAVSESTPGPLGVNMATYVGFTVAGVPGAIIATLSLILPGFLIALIIAKLFNKFQNNKLVTSFFLGVRPAVAALIATVCLELIKTTFMKTESFNFYEILSVFDPVSILIFLIMLLSILKFKYNPLFLLLAGGIFGAVLSL